MRTFRIILLTILGLIDIYLAYSTIGYIVEIFEYPKLIGDGQAFFYGFVIMAATFLVLFIIDTIIIGNRQSDAATTATRLSSDMAAETSNASFTDNERDSS